MSKQINLFDRILDISDERIGELHNYTTKTVFSLFVFNSNKKEFYCKRSITECL